MCHHIDKALPLIETGWVSETLHGLNSHEQKTRLILEHLHERAYVFAGFLPNLADGITAQFECDGHDILEHHLAGVYPAELADLAGYALSYPPFPGIALQNQKHIYQVFANFTIEDFDELGEVADGAELQLVATILQYVVQAGE